MSDAPAPPTPTWPQSGMTSPQAGPRTPAVVREGNSLSYTTSKRAKQPKKVINFEIDDETYDFTPPGTDAMTLDLVNAPDEMARVKVLFDWLGKGLPKEQHDHLIARVRDEDDTLSLETLSKVVNDLAEVVSGTPT